MSDVHWRAGLTSYLVMFMGWMVGAAISYEVGVRFGWFWAILAFIATLLATLPIALRIADLIHDQCPICHPPTAQ